MRRNTYSLDHSRVRFWGALGCILVLGVIALGSVFQNRRSETWLSMPSLWFFGLIVLPILLYVLVHFYWTRNDKVR